LNRCAAPRTLAAEFRRIANELRKPEILKLAILLTISARGKGSHAERGVAIAEEVLVRLGCGRRHRRRQIPRRRASEHAHIAERRDWTTSADHRVRPPGGNEELLRMLYLLTYPTSTPSAPGVDRLEGTSVGAVHQDTPS